MHLLESGEFLNVGLFCRVSCHERDTCLFLSQCLLLFFSSLIYVFMFFFA